MKASARGRLLVLCHGFPPYYGGGEFGAHALASAAAAGGWDVTVLTSDIGGRLPREETMSGLDVVRVPSRKKEWTRHTALELAAFYLSARSRAVRLARDRQPDALLAIFGFPAGMLALRILHKCGIPYVAALQGSDVPGYQPDRFGAVYPFYTPFIRRVWRRAAHVVAVSRSLADLARRTDANLAIEVIHNGADLTAFTPRPDACPPANGGHILRAVVAAQLIPRKGIQFLVEAASALAPELRERLRIDVHGTGPYEAELRALVTARGLGEQVVLHGLAGRESIPCILRQADFFVLPSLQEALPLALVEALACGLPVIVSRTGGIPEIVTHGVNGLLVRPGDVEGLSAAVADLLTMPPDKRRAMGVAARQTAEQLSWPLVWKRYETLLLNASGQEGAQRQ